MKKYYLFLILLSSFIGFAQFNPSAPWMKPINDTKKGLNKNKQTSINELKSTFDVYWESHNKNKKGSGFKPFMRWENHWSNKTNPQGFIITPEEMWSAFNRKNYRRYFNGELEKDEVIQSKNVMDLVEIVKKIEKDA